MGSPQGESRTLAALAVTNIVLAVLTASLAIGFVYFRFFYEPEADPQAAKAYVEEAQERFDQHADEISAEAASLLNEAVPPITSAVYKQAREDYPAYVRAVKTQGKEYLANVEQIFIDQVKGQYGDYLRAHRDVVKQEFPEHASDENVEKILTDLEETTTRIVERYYLDEFRRESERTIALWKRFEPVEIPGPDAPSLQEQLADYTADWIALTAAEKSKSAAAAQSAAAASQSDPNEDSTHGKLAKETGP